MEIWTASGAFTILSHVSICTVYCGKVVTGVAGNSDRQALRQFTYWDRPIKLTLLPQ